MRKLFSYILSACLIAATIPLSLHAASTSNIPAFPGAEGGGMYATGGRGGSIYYVTNLNDSGTGSFRDAVSQPNRIVLFKVGGTIELKSDVIIKSNITIAGQTAPGGAGITLKNYKAGLCGNNIIMRFISSRPGERKKNADYDALGGSDGSGCIVDHCSFGWANDEQWGLYSNNENATTQWSIIGPSNSFSYHSKGIHGFGVMFGKSNHTMHHNMLAHNVSRNFRGKVVGTGTVDFVNNVIYDWGYQTAYGTIGHLNYVGNYLKIGPSTGGGYNYVSVDSTTNPENFGMYLTDNKMVDKNDNDYKTLSQNNWNGITYGSSNGRNEGNVRSDVAFKMMVNNKDVSVATTAESATEAYEHVLQYAGAGINATSRPAIDQAVMYEAQTGTGSLTGARPYSEANSTQKATIDKYHIACGVTYEYPSTVTTGVPVDTDEDGMPDEWEKARGLNPNSKYAADGSLEANGDYCNQGYTNIEYYINDLTIDAFPEGTVTLSPTLVTPTPSPSPTPTPTVPPTTEIIGATIEEGTYMIKNVNSGLYLDVTGGTAANGTNVQQWGATAAAPYNTWKIVTDQDGYYKLYSTIGDGSYLLDVSNNNASNGTNIQIWQDTHCAAQLFKFVKVSSNTYGILTQTSKDLSCIEVANNGTGSGSNIQEYTYNGAKNQLWTLEKVTPTSDDPNDSQNDNNGDTPNTGDTDTPLQNADLNLTLNCGSTITSNTLTPNFTLTTQSGNYDLSKLTIRYYYTADSTTPQTAWLDTAALQYTCEPWYSTINATSQATIHTLSNGTSYLEISFSGNEVLNPTATLQINTRIAKDDWSNYDQSNDFSYNDATKVAIYYEGNLISGATPN